MNISTYTQAKFVPCSPNLAAEKPSVNKLKNQ